MHEIVALSNSSSDIELARHQCESYCSFQKICLGCCDEQRRWKAVSHFGGSENEPALRVDKTSLKPGISRGSTLSIVA